MYQLFKDFGLNEKETQVFIKMIELGAQPVSTIAKYVGVPRSSMYVILERLKKLSLVQEFRQNSILYIKPVAIKSLMEILKTKKRQLEQTETVLTENLPQLEALENKLSITPLVRFYEGKEAVMQMYEDILKVKEFFAIFNINIVKEKMPEYYQYVAISLKEKGGNAKEILVFSREAQKYREKFSSPKHQIKLLKKGKSFDSDTVITGEKIYMISYGEKEISGTEIKNSSLANTQKVLFEELWERL